MALCYFYYLPPKMFPRARKYLPSLKMAPKIPYHLLILMHCIIFYFLSALAVQFGAHMAHPVPFSLDGVDGYGLGSLWHHRMSCVLSCSGCYIMSSICFLWGPWVFPLVAGLTIPSPRCLIFCHDHGQFFVIYFLNCGVSLETTPLKLFVCLCFLPMLQFSNFSFIF